MKYHIRAFAALSVMALLLLAWPVPAWAAGNEPGTEVGTEIGAEIGTEVSAQEGTAVRNGGDAPTVSIKVNQVEASKTLEVSLMIDRVGPVDAASVIQSAASVLKYDTAKLELIRWDAAKTGVTLSESPTAGQTMAPGNVAGKPSLAFKLAATKAAGTDSDAGSGTGASEAFVYFGAQDQYGTGLEPGIELVTIRFKILGDLPTTSNGFTDALEIAGAENFDSEIQSQLPMVIAPAVLNVGGVYYRSDWTASMTDYERLNVKTDEIAAPTKHDSLYMGSETIVGSTGDYAITFFDWDGSVIDAIATSPSTAALDVQALTARYQNPAGTGVYTSDSAICLDNKLGYTFDQWLVVRQTEEGLELQQNAGENYFTSNEAAIPVTAGAVADFANIRTEGELNALVEKSTGSNPDTGGASKNILVQAAYRANEHLNTEGTGAQGVQRSQYTVAPLGYMQYGQSSGSDGKYAVTFEVKRENTGGAGVTRLREPAAAVFFQQVDSTLPDIITKLDLTNTDSTTFEVVPTKAMGQVMVYIIDAATVSAWPNAAEKSARETVRQADFVQKGSFSFIVQQCQAKLAAEAAGTADSADWANVNESAIYDATGITIPTAKKEAVKTQIKNAVRTYEDAITLEQMRTAVRLGLA